MAGAGGSMRHAGSVSCGRSRHPEAAPRVDIAVLNFEQPRRDSRARGRVPLGMPTEGEVGRLLAVRHPLNRASDDDGSRSACPSATRSSARLHGVGCQPTPRRGCQRGRAGGSVARSRSPSVRSTGWSILSSDEREHDRDERSSVARRIVPDARRQPTAAPAALPRFRLNALTSRRLREIVCGPGLAGRQRVYRSDPLFEVVFDRMSSGIVHYERCAR